MPTFRSPALSRPTRTGGFTLVELVIVMAITSLLATIAFIGQSQLRGRASFDSAIEKAVQDIDYTRNFATTNVNNIGGGTNTGVLLAGAGLEFNNVHLTHSPPFPLEEVEQIYAVPDASGNPDLNQLANCPPGMLSGGVCSCPPAQHPDDPDECFEQFFNLPDALTLYSPGNPAITGELVDYINTGSGLEVCIDDGIADVFTPIQTACAASLTTPLFVYLKDADGRTATIQVDSASGLAKRVN